MNNKTKLHQWTKADLASAYDAVSLLMMDSKNRVLVFHHNKLGQLSNPVGKVDPGDTVDDTFIKESKEELGIDIQELVTLGVNTNTYYRKGKTVKVTAHHAMCTKYTGVVTNAEPEKHKNLRWLTLDEIKKQPEGYLSNGLKWLIPWLEKHPDGRP